MIKIAVLAVPGCVASSVAGPLDVFGIARAVGANLGKDPEFAADVVALQAGEVPSFHGLGLSAHASLDNNTRYDVVLAPAMFGNLPHVLEERRVIEWMKRQHKQGALLCAVCAGVFLLAQTGLLNGREATTHWNLAAPFQERFPQIILKTERLLIDLGDVITAGGVTAYLDLCLHLVARLASPELAVLCSKVLLVEPGRKSQAPYAVYSMNRGHGDPAILRAQDWLEERLGESITLESLAQVAGLGVRTLLRRFRRATGHTPLEYAQRLRMESSKRLLETTGKSVEELAEIAGYSDPGAFRRAFKSVTGLSPGAYRSRFSIL